MSIDASDIAELLTELAARGLVFCSEKDFQLHLAWAMKARGWDLSLEYDPQCFDANAAIDILVHNPKRVAIELKYKTAQFAAKVFGRSLTLKKHGAQDLARYDFLRDIWRIEHLVGKRQVECGFAIFLTNDSSYWRVGRSGTADEMFRVFDGRSVVGGMLQWGSQANQGTMRKREKPISLTHDYVFGWKDYWQQEQKNGVFRYLMVEIEPSRAESSPAMGNISGTCGDFSA